MVLFFICMGINIWKQCKDVMEITIKSVYILYKYIYIQIYK